MWCQTSPIRRAAYDVAYGLALRHVLTMDDLSPPIVDKARDAVAALPRQAEPNPEAASQD